VRITPALPELLPSLLRDAQAALHLRTAAAAATTDGAAADDNDEAGSALLRLSLLTTLHAAVMNLGSLLHGSLPQLMALLVSSAARRDARSAAKADATLDALSERVELRLLIAPMYTTFKLIVAGDDHAPLLPLLAFGQQMLERASHADVLLQRMLVFKCCLACFEYRARYAASAAVDVADQVEAHLQALFVSLVLKLSETHFKPIFLKLQDWCTTSSTSVERAQFFYVLLGRIAGALRSIAVPSFEYVIPDIVQRLKPAEVAAAQRDADQLSGKRRRQGDAQQTGKLVVAILDALQLCFGHDRDQFIDQKRFDVLLPVIATQLEPRDDQSHAEYNELVGQHVQPCLLSLAVALNDEKYWRSIHNAVLAFAHHRSSRVRLMSLKIIDALYEAVGENMLPLLPETIPFLSELMEDSNGDVERFAHTMVERLEKVLGANQVRDLL
jgi:U3 small nucleolar RNA-associated protein 10